MDLSNYDDTNVFAKILRGEIPCKKIYEDEWVLAFHDVFPKAEVHALIISKKPYTCMSDFHAKASNDEILNFYCSIGKVTNALGVQDDGYRVVCNEGKGGGQEVAHIHLHVMSYSDGNAL